MNLQHQAGAGNSFTLDEAGNVVATTVATVTVTDPDTTYAAADFTVSGDADARFEVVSGASADEFILQIKAGSNFDHETTDSITLTISGPGGDHTVTVTIADVDEGDAVYVIDDVDTGTAEQIADPSSLGVGSVLYGRVQADDPDGNGTPSYQWQRKSAGETSFSNIASAIAAAYTLVAADIGAELRLLVTYTDDSNTDETVETASIAVPGHVDDGDASFTIDSSADKAAPKVGDTLTATLGTSDPDGDGTFSYQWYYVGGSDVTGATSATYTIVAGDVGEILAVRVSYTDGEGHAEQVSASLATTVAAATTAPAKLVDPAQFTIVTGTDASPNDENTLNGTAADEIIQGGNKADTISTGGGDDIVIGGYGDDTINLGAGAETVVYRFSSNSSWRADDGGDVINNFDRGTDKFFLLMLALIDNFK